MSDDETVQQAESKFQVFESSPEMQAKLLINRIKINFSDLQIGQSLSIPKSDIKLQTLRSKCSYYGKKMNAVFAVIVHENVYEVGRKA